MLQKEINIIKDKIKYFFENKIVVHIQISSDGEMLRYYDGEIIQLNKKCFLLNTKTKGTFPFYYSEIKLIEPFERKDV